MRPARGIQLRGEMGFALMMCGDEPFEQELALLFEPVFIAHAGSDLALDESQHRRDLRIVMLQRFIEFDGGFHRQRTILERGAKRALQSAGDLFAQPGPKKIEKL